MPSSTLITNARLFDGEKVLAERGFIFFNDSGLITDIGTDFSAIPPADTVIDASGNTVLPGLIDGHVHVHDGVSELAQAIKFGVTTVLDLFNEPDVISKLKNEASERVDIADVKSSCLAATIKDGWPRPVVLATLEDKGEVRVAY
jgi:dihydroorotase-like cyclic amidohydrolase